MADTNRPGAHLSRRELMVFLVRGSVLVPLGGLIRLAEPKEKFRRPPGAVQEEEFLALCTRCGLCQEVCPRLISLVPLTESVISAGTPRVIFNCSRCMRCNDVCPTGALRGSR